MQTTNMSVNTPESRQESRVRFHTSNRAELETLLAQSLRHIRDLEDLINALLQSKSWRLTQPLRAALDVAHRLRGLPVPHGDGRIQTPESIVPLLAEPDLIDAMLEQSNRESTITTTPLRARLHNPGEPSRIRPASSEQVRGLHSDSRSPLEDWFS